MKRKLCYLLIVALCTLSLVACGCEHEWSEATCTTPKTCSKCGESTGEVSHQLGEWEITKAAEYRKSGEKIQKCVVCNTVVNTKSYSLSEEEQAIYFKNECSIYSYDEIARYPDNYVLCQAKFTGEVMQVTEIDDYYLLLVNVTQDEYYWTDRIYVKYEKQSDTEPRILEDDIITMYGYLSGTTTYESILGQAITVPLFDVKYIEFN